MARNPTVFKMTEIPNSEVAKIRNEIAQEGKFAIADEQQDPVSKMWTLTVRRI